MLVVLLMVCSWLIGIGIGIGIESEVLVVCWIASSISNPIQLT